MIWGKTTKLLGTAKDRERERVAWRNKELCEWHSFFAFGRVELIDGRKALFSFIERQFFPISCDHDRTKAIPWRTT